MLSSSATEQGPAFFRLPLETRLQIYSYLLPKHRLDVNLCDLGPEIQHSSVHQEDRSIIPQFKRKRSPISSLASQNLAIEAITRSSGLHLLLVSKHTAAELTALLAKMTVRFHCPKCFDLWLRNVSYGLGVGIKWLKQIEILYDLMEPRILGRNRQTITKPLARFMVVEMMRQCQQTAYAFYGRLDLMDPPRERWSYEPFMGDTLPAEVSHPDYLNRTSSHMSLPMFNAQPNGGLNVHPWAMNGGFPAPGLGLPGIQGASSTRRGMGTGLSHVVHPNAPMIPEDEDPHGPATKSWVIKGKFNI